MMALSKVFYANVKRGFIKVEEITIPRIKKEVEQLLEQERLEDLQEDLEE